MQDEREDKVEETEDVEAHRWPHGGPEDAPGRQEESDEDEVEALVEEPRRRVGQQGLDPHLRMEGEELAQPL